MTRLRKLLVAGLMVLVTCCVSLGSAITNFAQSIFSFFTASANSDYSYKNENVATYTKGKVITVNNVPTEGTLNEELLIPKDVLVTDIAGATVTTGNETVVVIKNPYGDYIVDQDGSYDEQKVSKKENDKEQNCYAFKPTQVGIYTVQYAVKNGGVWTLSSIYNIEVNAEAYSIEFAKNDPIIMPSEIDTNVNTTTKLALPLLYDKDGKQITKFVLGKESNEYSYVAEYKDIAAESEEGIWFDDNNVPHDYKTESAGANGRNIYTSYSTYVVKKVADASDVQHGLLIEVTVPTATEMVTNSSAITTDATKLLKLDTTKLANVGDSTYYISAAYDFEASPGKNIITYKLCNADLTNSNSPEAYVNRTIDGNTAYDSTKIDLGVSIKTSNISNTDTSINKKVYLPEVSAVDKNANKTTLDAYYSYTVKYVDDSGEIDVTSTGADKVVMGIDENGVYFIPKVKGVFNIYYNATDFYYAVNSTEANKHTDDEAKKYAYDVNVTDRTSPVLKFTQSYNYVGATAENVGEDYSYVVPAKYVINKSEDASKWTKIAVPALFTEDNFKAFNDLTIKRTISSEAGFINSKGNTIPNFSIDIQSSAGKTDYNVVNADKDVNVEDVISFNENTYETYYIGKDANDNIEFYNSSDEVLTGNALIAAKSSQVAYITLNPNLFGEGKYTIEYSVSDGIYSNNSEKTFTFELVYADKATDGANAGKYIDKDNNLIDAEAPKVTFGALSVGNVKNNQEITVNVPEIKDTVDTGSSTSTKVNRTYTKNMYYVVIETEGASDYYYPLTAVDGKLTFNTGAIVEGTTKSIYTLATEQNSKQFKIVAYAYDDFADLSVLPTSFKLSAYEANPENYANIGVGSYAVTVKYSNDAKAPLITGLSENLLESDLNADFDQYAEKSVNGLVFYDDTASAEILVKVIDSNGNEVSYTELPGSKVEKLTSDTTSADYDAKYADGYRYKYTFNGVKFVANKSDVNYTINYTIVDGGNNNVSYAYVLKRANDKEAPVISGILGTTATLELGETYFFNDIKATDFSEVRFEAEVIGDVVGNQSSWFKTATNPMQFTPKAVDNYTITLKAIDAKGNASTRTFVVKVKDSKAPELKLSQDNTSIKYYYENEIDTSKTPIEFPEVELPSFTVIDYNQTNTGFNGVIGATGKITVTTPSSDAYSMDINGNIEGKNPLNIRKEKAANGNYYFYFTPTERGHYTIKYTGQDFSGNNSNEKTIDVYIGDTEKPVVTIAKELETILNKGFTVGDSNNNAIQIDTKAMIADGLKLGSSENVNISDNFGFKDSTKDTDNNIYTKLTVRIVDENNNVVATKDGIDGYYVFDKQGKYTLTITATDSVGNAGVYTKTFSVNGKASTTTDNNSKVLGIVLISVSIVILAGVVIYFVKGTKMLPKKKKATKKDKANDKE